MTPPETNPIRTWINRLAILIIVLFLLYLLFGDEDQAARNLVRAMIRGMARAL